jgi:hypothetical protein
VPNVLGSHLLVLPEFEWRDHVALGGWRERSGVLPPLMGVRQPAPIAAAAGCLTNA